MTPTEALAHIAAHCDELETDAHPGRLIAQVRAVLAEVTPEPGDPVPYRLGYEAGYADALRDVKDNAEPGDDRMADRAVWYRKGWEAALREAGGTLDRDQARALLIYEGWGIDTRLDRLDAVLDALAERVRPAAIDRHALITLLLDYLRGTHVQAEPLADGILALVRPVAGVTLTLEEAARIVRWYTSLPIGVSADDVELAGRLKEVAP